MSNKCKIYYGTVVNEDGERWVSLGAHLQEPIKVEGREPLGKPPEFCCKEFEEPWHKSLLYFYSDSRGQIEVKLRGIHSFSSLNEDLKVCFCPFCGAKIILLENLKLRAMKTTRTVESYYMEKAV